MIDPVSAGLAGLGVALGGGGALWAARALRPVVPFGIPVLRYRLVGPVVPGSSLNDLRLPLSEFEAQMRHLARRGFRAVTMSEAIARRGEREFIASSPIALTFDGLHACFSRAAWPILDRHGLRRVSLFIPPARLGEKELVLQEGRPEPLLSPDDLVALSSQGVELGLQLGGEGRDDLSAGKQVLERVSSGPVTVAAYAPGKLPASGLVRAVRAAGFAGGVLTGTGVILGRRTSPYAVPRFPVAPGATLVQVALAVAMRAR